MNENPKINRFKYIEAFSEVVTCGSVSAAAKKLGVSQPAVSQLIKKLEDAVGVPLFVRRNGLISPTDRATSLRDDVEQLLTQLDKIQMQLNFGRSNELTLNPLRFSASLSVVNEILPRVISHIHKSKPDMLFYVNSLPIANMGRAIRRGNVDLTLSTRQIDHANIISKRLLSAREVCVMPSNHSLSSKSTLSVDDIDNEKMIMASRTDPSYESHRSLLYKHKIRYQKVLESPFSTLSMSMIPELNALSINNVLIAELVCQHNDNLTWRYVDEFNHQTDFYLSMPPWLNQSTTENLFLASFQESLSETTKKLGIDIELSPSAEMAG
ncbi:MAG: LysR family transcriptional regulator [Candidatus Thioglobus sp.]|jgi:DNA-binding transcriptional LysR family regulator|nr:LysR family transcriptional regulator [Candidatus Thioglobus sp.]